jgi:hypothetical protein
VVKGDWPGAEKNQGECQSGQSQRKFVAAIAHQSLVEMHFGDGDRQIDADSKGRKASKQADQNEQAPKKFGEGREISAPCWQAEAGDELSMMMKAAENLLVSVADHDCAKDETHDQKRERLQTIKIAQEIPPGERRIDYSRESLEGSAGWR